MVIKVALSTKHENIGLDTHRLQFLHAVLGRLGLQFTSRLQIGHVGQMYTHGIAP